jgi:hypothetical protein
MLRILFVFILPLFYQSFDYQYIFSKDYENAREFMKKNASLFIDYSSSFQTDPEIIMPVLFPEAIRYSVVRNYLEIKSLELAYVYSGSADYSIGFFQMKPSFIENLEEMIRKQPEKLFKYDSLLINESLSVTEIRKERINRLKNLDYQIVYTNCMYDILKIIYPDIFLCDKPTQIKFISTAYNHGFLTGEKEILDYSNKAFFPMNGKNNTSRFVYNEISLYFYENDLPAIVRKIDNFTHI